ncbi:MAG TPA: hypothetical protein PKA88_34445, partial [Polyangiaceae bacterium]|nr:hypothetical protein [Polyangiaceae bacterium]
MLRSDSLVSNTKVSLRVRVVEPGERVDMALSEERLSAVDAPQLLSDTKRFMLEDPNCLRHVRR